MSGDAGSFWSSSESARNSDKQLHVGDRTYNDINGPAVKVGLWRNEKILRPSAVLVRVMPSFGGGLLSGVS